jgi:hypothetical protein
MKPTITLAIESGSMLSDHWKSVPPRIRTPQYDILIHDQPSTSIGMSCEGDYGKVANFDILLSDRFARLTEEQRNERYACVEGEDLVFLNYPSKHIQGVLLERVFRKNPVLMEEVAAKQVRMFANELTSDSNEQNAHKRISYFGDVEWLVLRVPLGASGQLHIKVRAELFYDFMMRTGGLSIGIKNTKDIVFSPDWFYDMTNVNNVRMMARTVKVDVDWSSGEPILSYPNDHMHPEAHARILDNIKKRGFNTEGMKKEDKVDFDGSVTGSKIADNAGIWTKYQELHAVSVTPTKQWVVTEFIPNVTEEFRFIKAGGSFWIRSRERSTGEYPQTKGPFGVDPHARGLLEDEPRVTYERCTNQNPLHVRMVKMAEALAKEINQDILTIDFFTTEDGKLGMFEFGHHFGIDNTDPKFVIEVWTTYVKHIVAKWLYIKQQRRAAGDKTLQF